MRKIAFKALIKDVKHKCLVSGDKATRIMIEFDSSNETKVLNELNYLQKGDRLVAVAIAEVEDE